MRGARDDLTEGKFDGDAGSASRHASRRQTLISRRPCDGPASTAMLVGLTRPAPGLAWPAASVTECPHPFGPAYQTVRSATPPWVRLHGVVRACRRPVVERSSWTYRPITSNLVGGSAPESRASRRSSSLAVSQSTDILSNKRTPGTMGNPAALSLVDSSDGRFPTVVSPCIPTSSGDNCALTAA